MNAIVSASAGRALFFDGESLFSIEAGALDRLVPRAHRDVPFLLGGRDDVEIMEGVDVESVRARLARSVRQGDALRWSLSLLDGDLAAPTRVELAKAVEAALMDPGARELVEGVLHAQPIPPDLDPSGAEEIASRAGCRRVASMLRELRARQAAVQEVHRCWEELPDKLFGGHADRQRARATVIRHGLFLQLARAAASGASPDGVITAALANPAIRSLGGHLDILRQWAERFTSNRRDELMAAPSDEPGEPSADEQDRETEAGRHTAPADSPHAALGQTPGAAVERKPEIGLGDIVEVHYTITEAGEERVRVFKGTVVQRHHAGVRSSFKLRTVASNLREERLFLLHSPRIVKIEVLSRGLGLRRTGKRGYLRRDYSRPLTARRLASKTSTTTEQQIDSGRAARPTAVKDPP